ncbi:conserved hypothetical protein [Dehalogenimonas lykanthroporepellens BL-DC-9]|nr:conserved hypothetical protein [Dehalogenimonas lykanthroporepellens BL-DC-9]
MNERRFIITTGLIALGLSAVLYALHYFVFQDAHHIGIFALHDIAFLPIEVFLVVVVIERLLAQREKKALNSKLNMVVGTFFMVVGNRLMRELLTDFCERGELYEHFRITQDWQPADFRRARQRALELEMEVDFSRLDLEGLRVFLSDNRQFLMTLMENPNLLEREAFTDLLWAITHLAEELEARPNLVDLPSADQRHLAGDINRFYDRLVAEWLSYAEHLKQHYPYFYSLLLRTHPFQERPSAVVEAGS